MSQSVIKKIQEIQRRAEEEIRAFRRQAVAEIVGRITALKEELKTLETQYAELTGKPVAATEAPVAKATRKRLSSGEKAALAEKLREILARNPTGVSMGELVKEAGESVGAVRKAVAGLKTKTTGAKATTRYFLK